MPRKRGRWQTVAVSCVTDSWDNSMRSPAPARDGELRDAVHRAGWAVASPVVPFAALDSIWADREPVLRAGDGGRAVQTVGCHGRK